MKYQCYENNKSCIRIFFFRKSKLLRIWPMHNRNDAADAPTTYQRSKLKTNWANCLVLEKIEMFTLPV